jgi:phytoene dehydrogenase-like protein
MADATHDAIIIGAGNKGLILAMYLTKYAGMDVALFERRHEAGGGWATDEGPAPGFLADYHSSAVGSMHTMSTERDFPEWVELGGKINEVEIGCGAIFKDDDSCLITYNRRVDPNQERTAQSIAQFSQHDADTWLNVLPKMRRPYLRALFEWAHTPALLSGVPDAMDKLLLDPDSGFDPSWAYKSPLEVLNDLFESDEMKSMILRNAMSWGFFPDHAGFGFIPVFLILIALTPRTAGVYGGTHQWAHAACKIIFANGGKIHTKKEVDRVIIENGTAKGVRLTDGTEVAARKMVISTLDPYNLCFRLIGKEHFDWQTLSRVENLERRYIAITWYSWALRELPNYKAASSNPDANRLMNIVMVSKDPMVLVREQAERRLSRMPTDLQLQIVNHSLVDKARVPEGKYAILTEQFVPSADTYTEKQWLEFKKKHADDVVKLLGEHTSNMSWDNVIGCYSHTPYDCCDLLNMAPTGNWGVIDMVPSQLGRFRPVPELAGHRTPIKNLYATGTAWHPFAAATDWQGYNCYKVIAEDFGLRKPWEETESRW